MLDPDRPASPWRVWAVALGVTAVVMLVLYGLTHHDEGASTQTAASTPATSAITLPAGPPASSSEQKQQSQQAQTNGQGGNAPAPASANSPKAQDRVNQPPDNAPANSGAPGKEPGK